MCLTRIRKGQLPVSGMSWPPIKLKFIQPIVESISNPTPPMGATHAFDDPDAGIWEYDGEASDHGL